MPIDIYESNEKARLILRKRALAHILALQAKIGDEEFGFKLLGRRKSQRTIIVSDIFVPTQMVSAGDFQTKEEGYIELSKIPSRLVVGWGHSHGFGHAFHSHEDENTDATHLILGLKKQLPLVSLTISDRLHKWDSRIYFIGRNGNIIYTKARVVYPYNIQFDLVKIHRLERQPQFIPIPISSYTRQRRETQKDTGITVIDESSPKIVKKVMKEKKKPWWMRWLYDW